MEEICRTRVSRYAPENYFGGYAGRVESGLVHDPNHRTSHEIDIAVFGDEPNTKQPLLSIGEAKWNDVMGMEHLNRLRRIRELLSENPRLDTSRTTVACYRGAGFMPALQEAAASGEVILVGPEARYGQIDS